MIYFTADHHFYHANIIKYCSRPFTDVIQMNDQLISNLNSRVTAGDTLYHLGDFCFGSSENYMGRVAALRGSIRCEEIHLILGNHDRNKRVYPSNLFTSIQREALNITLDGYSLRLSHYPPVGIIEQGILHLHGHCHNKRPESSNLFDVGVDGWNFMPVTLDEILDRRENILKKAAQEIVPDGFHF